MQKLSILIFLSFLSLANFAQSLPTVISGSVKDSKNDLLAGATVRLLKAVDSTTAGTAITNGLGKFNFLYVQNGSYLLEITAVGEKKFTGMPVQIDDMHNKVTLPVIVLAPSRRIDLAEVIVKSKRPLLDQEIDRTVVNVGSMISSATSNTLEVLEKTPGVTVNSSGEISLNGRSGVLVLIDGRSTYMSGQDLAAYLKSLPGSLVDKIELMDNPPARYDASGNAVINIRFKKNKDRGLTGSISTGYSFGKYPRSNDALSLNYNHKKVNLFVSSGYNHEKNYTDDRYDRMFFTKENEFVSKVAVNNYQTYKNNGFNTTAGLDYTASGRTTYGFLFNLNKNKRNGQLDYTSDQFNAFNQPDTIGTGATIGRDKRVNIGMNINLVHQFAKKGHELSIDANYLKYQTNGTQHLENYLFQPDGTLTGTNAFLYVVPSAINIYTAKADYTQPLKNKGRLDAGFKSSLVYNNNIADYYQVTGSSQTIDNSKSNHFRYRENINAAYVNTQKSWKRFGAQAGLRIENTMATGRQLGNDVVQQSSFTKNYTKLFTSVFLSYKLDSIGQHTLNFIVTRRINRPNYQLLNPFVFFRDKYSYTSGNPQLSPQYQYRYELRYQHKQLLRVGLSYNRFTDVIFQTTQAVNEIFITKPQNVAHGHMILLNTGVSLSPAAWWKINTDILLSHMGLNGLAYTETLNPSTYVARLNVLNQLSLKKGYSMEFGGYYASRDLNGQAITIGMYRVNAAFQKKFWKDKASVRLGVDDLFHSWIYHNKSVSIKQSQYFQTSESDTQRVGLAFTYRFGNSNFARKSQHTDNASDDEKGRVN